MNCSNEGTRKESALLEWLIFLHLWLNQPASAFKEKSERSLVNVGTSVTATAVYPCLQKSSNHSEIPIIVNEGILLKSSTQFGPVIKINK